MRRLFLIRHAKAEPSVGRDDYERRLTDRGRADARRVAAALAARKMLPDLLVHSGAARAKETAEIFAAEWTRRSSSGRRRGSTTPVGTMLLALTRALPDARAARRPRRPQPGLGELATALIGSGAEPEMRRLAAKYPTGAVAALDFSVAPLGGRRAQVRDAGALLDAGRTRGGRGLSVGQYLSNPYVPSFEAGRSR